ncbi:MAG TPA: type VI secretion system contractile sheath large subunit [Longimicrobiaceae bacterium]
MPDTQTATAPSAVVVQDPTLLDQVISQGKMVRDEAQKVYAGHMISQFAVEAEQGMSTEGNLVAAINQRIEQIDQILSQQLSLVMHHPDFQAVEATWRGLGHLVKNSETGTELKLRVLDVTKKELLSDLENPLEFDQTVLFKKLYEEEYGTFGGAPYSVLVGDYEFGRTKQDQILLAKMAEVAAAAHAPFIAAAAPGLFDMESFTELGTPRDLAKIFDSVEMVEWNNFRKSEDSRYVSLVLPHVMMRLPYGKDTVPVEKFSFEEDVSAASPEDRHKQYLWGNAAWFLAQRMTDAFAKYKWTAAIRGYEGGGKVEGLPVHVFTAEDGDKVMKCPTEVSITDRREKELDTLGFISLCHCKGENYAVFFGGSTAQKPVTYNTHQANANARLSALLPYIMAASRFAHYLKVMVREKVGSFESRSSLEKYLNSWIADYVLLNDDAPQSAKAQYPLREARVDVVEVPGKPGAYKATVFLRPHFQLEELTASIRLVAELPAPQA